jgi:hypothetical protein
LPINREMAYKKDLVSHQFIERGPESGGKELFVHTTFQKKKPFE